MVDMHAYAKEASCISLQIPERNTLLNFTFENILMNECIENNLLVKEDIIYSHDKSVRFLSEA